MIRVVLDTNILVKAVAGRSKSGFVLDALFRQQYTLCVSTAVLLEYNEILTRIYDKEVADLTLSAILALPNVVRTEVYFNWRLITADADDDKIADCAIASNAHLIVTDDRHFKVLTQVFFPKIEVVSNEGFKSLLLKK